MTLRLALLLVPLLSPLTGCRSSAVAEPIGDAYVLVVLRSGPGLPEGEALDRAVAGHFANMERLAEEGLLFAAGPLGEPRAAPDHRGLFWLDVPDAERALELAATDPAVQAGVFVVEAWPLRSAWDLPEALYRDQEALLRDAFAMRGYVLALAPDHARARRRLEALVADGRAGVDARLAGERDGQGLFLLHTDAVDVARAWMTEIGAEGWELMPWWGTASLEQLPRPGASGADAPGAR